MMKGWSRFFIVAFFYAAFIAFLLPSVPHVAFFFRSFEPFNTPLDQDWTYVAYGIAIVIDFTVLIMTWAESKLKRMNRPFFWDRAFVWAFIALATGISIVANWQYSIQFASSALSQVKAVNSDLVNTWDPIIVSLFPLFQIIYSRIADVIIGKEMTVAELQAQLDEVNKRKPIADKIDAIRAQQKAAKVDGLFAGIGHIKDRAMETFKTVSSQVADENQSAESPDAGQLPVDVPSLEQTTSSQVEATNMEIERNENDEQSGQPSVPSSSGPQISLVPPTPITSRSMSIEEAASFLGIQKSSVIKLRGQGKLKRSGNSDKFLLRKSVETYAQSHSQRQPIETSSSAVHSR